MHGIGSGVHAFITVVDPRFHNQVIEINPDTDLSKKPLSVALQTARTLTGRVTYADTGKPAARARVQIAGFDQFHRSLGARPIITTTDDAGRFRASPGPGADGFVSAFAPDGQPYVMAAKNIDWPKGAVSYSADLALPRGTLVRGQVTEHGSGRRIPDALVTLFHGRSADDSVPVRATRPVRSRADGSLSSLLLIERAISSCVDPPTTLSQRHRRRLALNEQPAVRARTSMRSSPGNRSPPAKVKTRTSRFARRHGQRPSCWAYSCPFRKPDD